MAHAVANVRLFTRPPAPRLVGAVRGSSVADSERWTTMSDTARSRSDETAVKTTPRREEIMATATDLFHAQGYANVGMRAIADAVGVRPASLYHHFASKEAILFALSLRVTEQFVEETVPLLTSSGDRREALRTVLVHQIVFSWENRGAIEVTRREMRELSPDNLVEVLYHRARYRRMIQEHVAAGVESGEFVAEHPKLAGLAILSMVNGVNDWFHEDHRGLPGEEPQRTFRITDVAHAYADMIVEHLLQ